MSKFFVSVKITPDKYKHFEVPYDVYVINQLENAVKNPETSKLLKKLYPDKF